jgi:hypothetical protein
MVSFRAGEAVKAATNGASLGHACGGVGGHTVRNLKELHCPSEHTQTCTITDSVGTGTQCAGGWIDGLLPVALRLHAWSAVTCSD